MNTSIKERLIAACIERQKVILSETETAANELQEQINNYGQNKDRYDSFRTKLTRSKEQMQQMQQQAVNCIKALSQMPVKTNHIVEHGSIVITDKQYFFIAVGIGKLHFDNHDFFVISGAAPIFKMMKNKQVGDEFTFNKITYKILKIE
ncbi:MAG: hypothetical protein IKS33_01875 [Bacteroidales bacterium]|jgi:hypothetical protein|nr:hypothetical protein [Bacteroidales bacterium]MBQ4477080.1 hypothetical protein [Bacteroidales bacterium]MBR4452988.1 hypothetical protein [Bacteroidales bacterium]MCR5555223.1 GreA/GreB family elongation factor [Bacteroidales bacterium]